MGVLLTTNTVSNTGLTFWDAITYLASTSPATLVFSVVFIFVLVLVGIRVVKPDFKLGRNHISFKNNTSQEHAKLVRSFFEVIRFVQETSRETTIVTEKMTIRDQMNYAEQKLEEITDMFNTQFIRLLKDRNGELFAPIESEEYRRYQIAIEQLRSRYISEFRHIMRENHLTDMSEEEFQKYLSHKCDYLISKGQIWRDELYEGVEITTKDLRDTGQAVESEFYQKVRDILITARKISTEKDEFKKAKDEQAEQKVQEFLDLLAPTSARGN